MKSSTRCVALAILALLVSAHIDPAVAQTARGGITGTVDARVTPRRTAVRYPTGTAAARAVQVLPAVVYLEGVASGDVTRSGGRVRIAQRDTAFAPSVLAVPPGTVVEFLNEDDFFHNVFSYSEAKRFDLGRLPRGQSSSVTLERAGVVRIYCEVHEFMRAAVVVVESQYHAIVDAEGRFTLNGVPAGRYTLVSWHPDRGRKEVAVAVAADAVTRVTVQY
jgi:plastocyanin